MLFSTKAEYGVRLMVELGRRAGETAPDEARPVSLGAVAESETLPLSYLEHLVARLREAGLVSSVRGAHGGYRLAKPAEEIAMLDVVEALEGPIAPMECFHVDREGRVLCSHESDGDRACATKLLWTRVQGGVNKALAGTTLAELAAFAAEHDPKGAEGAAGDADAAKESLAGQAA
jgi:Rrf2 family cysteine metabolism transcriptional repressor